jgi:RNA polymerase sigma-70 factor (family 1)
VSRDMKLVNDVELLAALKRGEDEAFDQLFRFYFASLSFFAFQITRRVDVAEDITQDCFLKLWRLRDTLSAVTELRAYLYSSVRNQCMEWLKKQRQQELKIEGMTIAEVDDSTEQHIIRAETVREIHRVVQLLPPRMREVFTLYYLEGKSTREISQLLQTSIETVRHQRKHALKFFREQFIPG